MLTPVANVGFKSVKDPITDRFEMVALLEDRFDADAVVVAPVVATRKSIDALLAERFDVTIDGVVILPKLSKLLVVSKDVTSTLP